MNRLTGSCQCGAVSYELRQHVPILYICHCLECQRQSASAFGTTKPIRREWLSIAGELEVYVRKAHSGGSTACRFCPRCGCRLLHEDSQSKGLISLKAGTLDDRSGHSLVAELWVCRKLPWLRTAPDVPTFDTQPDNLASWREEILGERGRAGSSRP